jgi:hypothetical protein
VEHLKGSLALPLSYNVSPTRLKKLARVQGNVKIDVSNKEKEEKKVSKWNFPAHENKLLFCASLLMRRLCLRMFIKFTLI